MSGMTSLRSATASFCQLIGRNGLSSSGTCWRRRICSIAALSSQRISWIWHARTVHWQGPFGRREACSHGSFDMGHSREQILSNFRVVAGHCSFSRSTHSIQLSSTSESVLIFSQTGGSMTSWSATRLQVVRSALTSTIMMCSLSRAEGDEVGRSKPSREALRMRHVSPTWQCECSPSSCRASSVNSVLVTRCTSRLGSRITALVHIPPASPTPSASGLPLQPRLCKASRPSSRNIFRTVRGTRTLGSMLHSRVMLALSARLRCSACVIWSE
mmetsp:Transcript_29089/g.65878  ORF Transcript_29089/g.65878 Transcript_29089/m.65878 type:complete len:272 (+) Transcript_29089:28-843(+)